MPERTSPYAAPLHAQLERRLAHAAELLQIRHPETRVVECSVRSGRPIRGIAARPEVTARDVGAALGTDDLARVRFGFSWFWFIPLDSPARGSAHGGLH